MSIGDNIKKFRESKGLPQWKLAEILGVNQAMITRYENGSKIPTVPICKIMAKVFDCTVDDLVNSDSPA